MLQHFLARRGAALAAALLACAFTLAVPTARAQDPAAAEPAGAFIDSVKVSGNQRVGDAAIRATSALRPGALVRGTDVQNAIRRLMETGDFESVEVRTAAVSAAGTRPRVTLELAVQERPILAAVEFRGLQSVSAKTVRDTLKIEEGKAFNPAVATRAEQMIRQLLAKAGRQVVSVDTSITPVKSPAGAVRLTFTVREGNRLAIADVDFEGNEAFSEDRLQDVLKTKEEGFFWFRGGKFDRETFREDLRERLPSFYGSHGYIDFAVASDTLIVDPRSGKARLVVTVAEGPQYRLGEFRIEGNSRFPTEELEHFFRSENRSVLGLPFGGREEREQGEVFNRIALDDATRQVRQKYTNEGYLFAQIEPVVKRVPATAPGQAPTANVVWAISERQPFYVRNIRIEGNSYTHESVIRERLLVLPGDVYNEERLIASYTGVGALGYFETPLPTPDIDPDPEAGTVDITFHVKEKQTASVNFGTSIGGGYGGSSSALSGFLGFTQPNLFGQGKQASVRAEWGPYRQNLEASYSDPSLFGGRNSGSVSIFHTGDRYYTLGDVKRTRTGGALQFGVPIAGFYRTRAIFGYSLYRTAYDGTEDEQCTRDSFEIACLPDATASNVSIGITRDTKSHPLFPISGTRQTLTVEQTGGPLGGDGNFQKGVGSLEWWVPAGRIGASGPGQRPVRLALGLQARAGAIFGDVERFPFEQFYAGGTRFGQPLRGYKEASINAMGVDESCGELRLECVGNSFLILSAEYAARVNDQISIGLFGDAGSVWRGARQFNPNRLFRGAGIGGTVVTPFGPIGVDLAYGFDRPVPGWEVHFNFGQGF